MNQTRLRAAHATSKLNPKRRQYNHQNTNRKRSKNEKEFITEQRTLKLERRECCWLGDPIPKKIIIREPLRRVLYSELRFELHPDPADTQRHGGEGSQRIRECEWEYNLQPFQTLPKKPVTLFSHFVIVGDSFYVIPKLPLALIISAGCFRIGTSQVQWLRVTSTYILSVIYKKLLYYYYIIYIYIQEMYHVRGVLI